MKRLTLTICTLVILAGIPLIWRAWPPLPTPEWDEGAIFTCDLEIKKDGFLYVSPPKGTRSCHLSEAENKTFEEYIKRGLGGTRTVYFAGGMYFEYSAAVTPIAIGMPEDMPEDIN